MRVILDFMDCYIFGLTGNPQEVFFKALILEPFTNNE
jgi:hypothetical protein